MDIAILGAGASGLMCASFLKGKDYALIEHNSSIGAKIKISGGGRCNITNKRVSFKNYLGDPEFVKEILNGFSNEELIKWLKKRSCSPVLKKKNQFFCPHSSQELIDIFLKEIEEKKIFLNREIKDVKRVDGAFLIETSKENFYAKKVVVATGGVSYKKIGATEIGYKIAKKFGHEITPLRPALVGFTVQSEQFWFKELSGISFEAVVQIKDKIFKDNILFAHKGISGPAILNASLYWDKGGVTIDFLNGKKVEEFLRYPYKQIVTLLPFPKRFSKLFLNSIGIKDKKIKELKKEDLKRLKLLEKYTFSPAGTFGFERAEVTKGGVVIKDIDKNSLMSKKVKNLYFIGEVLDVTGELGGYNFQWAFSSAVKAARHIDDTVRDC